MLKTNILKKLILSFVFTIHATDFLAAEKYTELPSLEVSREERSLARQFSKGDAGAGNAAARDAFRKYIGNDLRRLTQIKEISRYGDIRNSIQNSYLAIYKEELKAARAEAITQIVYYANGVAKSNKFSPQSRINFVALLAELDDQPRIRAAPPLPAKAAFQPLYEIANNAEMPLYLRAIALHGLERQIGVRWYAPGNAGWSDEIKQGVQKGMLAIVKSQPKNPIQKNVHAWVQRRAFDCLGAASSPAAVDDALQALGDPKRALPMRMTCAQYLCQLDAASLSDDQKSNYALGLAHLVRSGLVHWYEHEDDLLQRAANTTGGGGMYGGMGGMGMGMGDGMDGYDGGGMGMGSMEGGSMDGYGGGEMDGYGSFGGTGANSKIKAVDVQDWENNTFTPQSQSNCSSQPFVPRWHPSHRNKVQRQNWNTSCGCQSSGGNDCFDERIGVGYRDFARRC